MYFGPHPKPLARPREGALPSPTPLALASFRKRRFRWETPSPDSEPDSPMLGPRLPRYKRGWPSGRTVGWDGTNGVGIAGLLLTSCVTMNKGLNLAKPGLPPLWNGALMGITEDGCVESSWCGPGGQDRMHRGVP